MTYMQATPYFDHFDSVAVFCSQISTSGRMLSWTTTSTAMTMPLIVSLAAASPGPDVSGQQDVLGHSDISQRCWAVKQLASKHIILVVLLADHPSQRMALIGIQQTPPPFLERHSCCPLSNPSAHSTHESNSNSATQSMQSLLLILLQ